MLRLIEAAVAPGGEPLVHGVDWAILPGEKVGVVGRNGTGKTTLLRALLGEQLLDAGRREGRPGLVIGWLPQGAVAGVEGTVWEVARSGMVRHHALAERLAAAEAALARGEPGALERHAAAEDVFRQAGGYAVDQVTGGVLHGLGFGPETWHRPCDTFSGGWQMRVALARMLLSEPDLALLDEPTNHLDLAARSWLSGYLSRVPYAVVVVSHDRYLLERVPGKIVEVRGGRLHHFTGNYRTWRKERERRLEAERAAFVRQQGEIARLERFVERFGAKATKAAQARSRQNALDRMDRLEAPEEEGEGPRLRFPAAPASDREVLKLDQAAFGWPDGPIVLGQVQVVLERGQRVVVLGPNGIGKSTLLHALAGRLPLRAGRRRVGDRVRVGVFTQDLAAELPGDETGLTWLEGVAPALPPQRLRAILGGLGLSGDDALRPIHQLSGGERARVALAGLVARSCNVLLLDEPTNHLDAETCDALADALEAFDGAVLLVSHDRSLVEQLATHTWRVLPGSAETPGRVEVQEGLRPEFFEPPPLPGEAPVERSAAVDHAERKRRARELERLARRVVELEGKISAAETALAGLEEQLYDVAADPKRFQEVTRQQQQGRRKLDDLTAQWEEAETAREALARSLAP